MPGQAIGTQIPLPKNTVFSATISISEQGGEHTLRWNFEGDQAIAARIQTLLEQITQEKNVDVA